MCCLQILFKSARMVKYKQMGATLPELVVMLLLLRAFSDRHAQSRRQRPTGVLVALQFLFGASDTPIPSKLRLAALQPDLPRQQRKGSGPFRVLCKSLALLRSYSRSKNRK